MDSSGQAESVTGQATEPAAPIRLAIVNDYGVIVAGLQAMLAPHRGRIRVVELDANMPVSQDVDVVLYDTFARTEPGLAELRTLAANPHAGRVVVFSWSFDDRLVELALSLGAAGYVSKTSTGEELADALVRVHRGERVILPRSGRRLENPDLEWPGRVNQLTAREAEVLALITQGRSNIEIAGLLHLSINTIKSAIRSTYRKIGVTNRVEAVIWGTSHGMGPDQQRIRTSVTRNAKH